MNARRECHVCHQTVVVGRGGGLCAHTRQVKAAQYGVWVMRKRMPVYTDVPPVHEACPGATKGERP